MKGLRKKTSLTIFTILTAILITFLAVLNINSYRREYSNIERGLKVFDDRGGFPDAPPAPDGPNPGKKLQKPRELDNMMIMDNEVYTVRLNTDGGIESIVSHGAGASGFDVEGIAGTIMDAVSGTTGERVFIGNLYLDDYSYLYREGDLIVILNNADKADKLKALLLESVLILFVMGAVLFMVSRLITGWIVKPAEEAFRKQKEFIADASHELKTPLAVITASSDALAEEETGGGSNRYLENIRYESDRMNRLITGLLDLSKLEDGRDASSYREENLSRIIEKTCLIFDGIAFEQAVTIESDIEENMMFRCSRDEMEKLFSTILDNAVRHSNKDTTVHVCAHTGKGCMTVTITNTGDPIPEEECEKIFERFYRSDKARNRADNRYGLGLAIAKRIAQNHNGTIRASSGDGTTTFEIVLKK
ncbi:MAG: HAMP domain-containing histidine kinase [Lachnospiraceae bacterium]|nr:HAMP domain-containing histidine kinase [Lachnospiraceae bacterium]